MNRLRWLYCNAALGAGLITGPRAACDGGTALNNPREGALQRASHCGLPADVCAPRGASDECLGTSPTGSFRA